VLPFDLSKFRVSKRTTLTAQTRSSLSPLTQLWVFHVDATLSENLFDCGNSFVYVPLLVGTVWPGAFIDDATHTGCRPFELVDAQVKLDFLYL
jgi:hypothetical protein